MNSTLHNKRQDLIGLTCPAVKDLIKMISTDRIEVIMSDRNMHLDDSEREILVYGQGSDVQDVAFGVLSNVPSWVKIWSGTCIIDDCYLDRDSNKAVLSALVKRIKEIRNEKATLLLSELPIRAKLAMAAESCDTEQKPSLKKLLQEGSNIFLSNHHSEPIKSINCPIFLNLDVLSSQRLGLEGLQGFYNSKTDRAVVTDGTFFVVSQGKEDGFFKRENSVKVYMRTPRLYLPGIRSGESKSECLIQQCFGEVAGNVHFALKNAIEDQIRKVGRT